VTVDKNVSILSLHKLHVIRTK